MLKNLQATRYILLSIMLLIQTLLFGQTTLVYSEDFENGPGSFTLNQANEIGTNSGRNRWVVNNAYNGQGIYPNTISQDSTFGGLINFAPFSNYLHVTDSVQANNGGPSNANFNPSFASDRVAVTSNFCTLGLNNVIFAFYYLCVGSSNAFGELYFSTENGPWQLVPNSTLNNTNKWKYVEFSNPAFNNVENIRFAFRWKNEAGSPPPTVGLGIDAIRLVGVRDPITYPVSINITNIIPNPVCQQNNVILFYTLSQPLCGTGFYEFQLSNAGGEFINPVNLGIFQLQNNTTGGAVQLQIPANTTPNNCYKIRIIRGDVIPVLISEVSICFEVQACPNVITTLGPAVISNPSDTVCVGSVIDIPFFSTGVYVNNTYVAQLSDSSGNFPPNPNVLGTFPNSATYDPALGSLPGNVSGLIQPLFQPIPPGCNYFIRIVSINPSAIGSTFGPFCIRNCDIETNNRQDLQFCIDNINGADTSIVVEINQFDSLAVYAPNSNEFQVQVLNSQTFAVINTGVIGSIMFDNNTNMQVTIPNLPGLFGLGMIPGMYYIRVIATNSSTPWNNLGTLIRLTIGAPNPAGLTIQTYDPNAGIPPFNFPGDSTVCINDGIFFTFTPFNPASTYNWTLDNDPNWATERFIGILFNGIATNTLTVQETNFGCVGPVSPAAIINVIGPPNVNVTGPLSVCVGDTATYSVPLAQSTFYSWSATNAALLDTLNNIANFAFNTVGQASVFITAVNKCGTRNGTRNVNVRPLPLVDAGNDTSICKGSAVDLTTTTGTNYVYYWYDDDNELIGNTNPFTVTPNETTTFVIRTTSFGNLACESKDTVTVFVEQPIILPFDTLQLCKGKELNLTPDSTGISYVWNNGAADPFITVNDSGWFSVNIEQIGKLCALIDSFKVNLISCYEPFTVPTIFTPNSDGFNDFYLPITTFNYEVFEFFIYNRWGQMVYKTQNPFFTWDGTDMNSGNELPDGTYFYLGRLKHEENSDEVKGSLTLLKNQ